MSTIHAVNEASDRASFHKTQHTCSKENRTLEITQIIESFFKTPFLPSEASSKLLSLKEKLTPLYLEEEWLKIIFLYTESFLTSLKNHAENLSKTPATLPRKTSDIIIKRLKGIPLNKIESIGKDKFGTVESFSLDGDIFACKSAIDSKTKNFLEKEWSILTQLNCEYIVSVEFITTSQLFLEYFPEGSLDKYIPIDVLTVERISAYSLHIAKGLQYLHTKKYTHKDIKPANILVRTSPPIAKLCDFGLTTLTENDTSRCGTEYTAAPEIFDPNPNTLITTACDVWSFGILLYEMVTNRDYLFSELSRLPHMDTVRHICANYLDKPLDNSIFPQTIWINKKKRLKKFPIDTRDPSKKFRDIILSCLHQNPEKRISDDDLVKGLEDIHINSEFYT